MVRESGLPGLLSGVVLYSSDYWSRHSNAIWLPFHHVLTLGFWTNALWINTDVIMCNKLEQIGHNDDNNRRTLWAVREHKQAELLKKEETGPICCVTLIQTWLTLNNTITIPARVWDSWKGRHHKNVLHPLLATVFAPRRLKDGMEVKSVLRGVCVPSNWLKGGVQKPLKMLM